VKGYAGIIFVLLGCLVLALNIRPLNDVVLSAPGSHGVHISDIAGSVGVALGICLVWFR
jgi:hypothetical protein